MSNTVCDIRPFFISRFIYGYYLDFPTSHRVNYILRLYSVFAILAFVLYFMYTYVYYSLVMTVSCTIEYLFYLLISYVTKDRYIIDYCRYDQRIDGQRSLNTYRPLAMFIIVCTVSQGFLLLADNLFLCTYAPKDCNNSYKPVVIDSLIAFCLAMGRLTFVLVFALFFYRVRNFCKTFKLHDFNNTAGDRYWPQKYIQMYEALLDSFRKINTFIEPQLTVYLICGFITTVCSMFNVLSDIKEKGANWFQILWIALEIFYTYFPLIIAAVLSDLISTYFQNFYRIVVEKRIECKNERLQAEIQKLVVCMKHRPHQYRVCRTVPLTVRTLLSVVSYCITTLIAVLQIKTLSS